MPPILSLPDSDTAVSIGFCFLAGAGWFIHKRLVSGRHFDTVEDLAQWLEGHFDEGVVLLEAQILDYLHCVAQIGIKRIRVISQGEIYYFSAICLPHVKIRRVNHARRFIRGIVCLIEEHIRRGVPSIGDMLADAIENLPEDMIVDVIAPVELPGILPQAPPHQQGVPAPPQQEGFGVNQGVPPPTAASPPPRGPPATASPPPRGPPATATPPPRGPTASASPPPSPHRGRLLPLTPPPGLPFFSPIATRTRGETKRKAEAKSTPQMKKERE